MPGQILDDGRGHFARLGRVVGRFLVEAHLAGDLVILDAEQTSDAGVVQVRLDVVVIEIEAHVAVEVALAAAESIVPVR